MCESHREQPNDHKQPKYDSGTQASFVAIILLAQVEQMAVTGSRGHAPQRVQHLPTSARVHTRLKE